VKHNEYSREAREEAKHGRRMADIVCLLVSPGEIGITKREHFVTWQSKVS